MKHDANILKIYFFNINLKSQRLKINITNKKLYTFPQITLVMQSFTPTAPKPPLTFFIKWGLQQNNNNN